jgi:homoserine O-succinyltransferase
VPGNISPAGGPAGWRCALVNNMPDGAFASSEAQFANLLAASAGGDTVVVDGYVMGRSERSPRVAELIEDRYRPVEELWTGSYDVAIITGAEPATVAIDDELWWADLISTIEWARAGGARSVLVSCLAAHAALAYLHGVRRTPLATKCAGVFVERPDPGHSLAAGLENRVLLPHSRWNSVPLDVLEAAGCRVALRTDVADWSVATTTVGDCPMVLVQAHPEYCGDSLVREYHRDLRRYLGRRHDRAPVLPWHCVATGDWPALVALHERVTDGDRSPTVLARFDFDGAERRAGRPWCATARTLYANWLDGVSRSSVADLPTASKRSA